MISAAATDRPESSYLPRLWGRLPQEAPPAGARVNFVGPGAAVISTKGCTPGPARRWRPRRARDAGREW
ncbi:hypothetical protein SLI_4712 [Streptomyces lividans 1326]|uniref:Uncharacterized protein n=1 Tax=Streptomyces lividans 1326 TaxID=1200984 RepID=A0A7U9HCI2_STRLI|nr:hypothetical protein SLI_4712 [Streptomyces lividans 1326]